MTNIYDLYVRICDEVCAVILVFIILFFVYKCAVKACEYCIFTNDNKKEKKDSDK